MELRQLRYFIQIVEEGSFSAAARRLGIAQPSLSQQIQKLEEELGEVLLKRGARGISITDAGKLAYQHARSMVADGDSLLASFQARGSARGGEVTFGAIPTIAPSMLPDVLAQFHESSPEVRVHVRESQTSDLVRMVVDEEVEFAVVSDIDAATRKKWSLHVKTLFQEPLLLAVSSKDPLVSRERAIKLSEIDAEELLSLSEGHCLRDQTLAVCRPNDIHGLPTCEQLPTLLALVKARFGVAFVPGMFVRENNTRGVDFLQIRDPEPHRAINIMKRRGRKLAPPAEGLLKLIGEWT